MPAFGITPVGTFPPASSDGFPRFIQFSQDGTDVGDRAVENLNFTGGAGLTVNSSGSTVTVDLGGAPASFTWLEVPGDYTLTLADADMGLATTGTTGAQTITVPPAANVMFDAGAAILVHQDGPAQAQIAAGIGVQLIYRYAFFNPHVAGEGGVLTLIYRGANRWIVCGDLERL